MAFSEELLKIERYWPLHFYLDADIIPNSGIDDSLNLSTGKKWRLGDIRVHFSQAVVSATDLMINISSILGADYNTKLLSQAIVGIQDIFIHYSSYLQFNSGDTLNITTSTFSVAQTFGIEAFGWAVVG